MPSDSERLLAAVSKLSEVDALIMEPKALVEDLLSLLGVYGEDFERAVESLAQAVRLVAAGKVSTSCLKYDLSHIRSYHFQSAVRQGQRADMRLAFVPAPTGIEVISFGNRHEPEDFYDHLKERA